MTRRPILGREGALLCCTLLHGLTALLCGSVNLLHELGFSDYSRTLADVCSGAAVLLYGASIVWSARTRVRDVATQGMLFWGMTLIGFFFYACTNLLDMTLAFPIPYMTAFLRVMMTMLTLPVLAYNRVILAMPALWLSFAAALALPCAGFIAGLLRRRALASGKKEASGA